MMSSHLRLLIVAMCAVALSGCGQTVATPLPDIVATDSKQDVAAARREMQKEMSELNKKKQTHQKDAIKEIEAGR